MLGTKLNQRYALLSVIGIGGWSTVYRAQDEKLNRLVAVKILHSQHAVDQTKLQRFQQEAEAASVLIHPNLAVIHDFGALDDGRPYIVMELVEGTTIADLVSSGERFSPQRCIDVFTQACSGLTAVHATGLIHRDLKPSNIMVTEAAVVKVLDFGVAKFVLRDGQCLTQTDEAVGTPFYMSPEQCMGKALDGRSDIYSLGCTMYEAITGVKPFPCDNILECMRMQIKVMPARIKSASGRTDVSAALEAIIFKSLAKSPAERFASADALAQALKTCQNDGSPWQELLLRFVLLPYLARNRTPWPAMIALLTLLVVAGSLSSSWWMPAVMPHQNTAGTAMRALKFPSDRSVGTIALVTSKSNFSSHPYAVAQGTVLVPGEAVVMLSDVPPKESADFDFLARLNPQDLQYLYISAEPISTKGFHAIAANSSLQSINLEGCQFSDDSFKDLQLPNLGGLDLHESSITDAGLSVAASSLNKVSWLSLADTKITDSGANCISKWRLLKFVNLSGTAITDNGLSFLTSLHQLQTLNISNTQITNKSLPALSSATGLKHLNVASTRLSDKDVDRLKRALPGCEVLTGTP